MVLIIRINLLETLLLLILIPCCYHNSSVFTLVTVLTESATNGEWIPSHRECERGGFRDAENITSPHSYESIQTFVPPTVSSPLCVVADSVLIVYNLYHSLSSSPYVIRWCLTRFSKMPDAVMRLPPSRRAILSSSSRREALMNTGIRFSILGTGR